MIGIKPPKTPNDIREKLNNLYIEDIISPEGWKCKFEKQCANSCNLYGKELLFPIGAMVGDFYEKHKILFIGINSNDGAKGPEDFYACYEWLQIKSIAISKVIWYLTQRLTGEQNAEIGEAMDRIAFTNCVKCSVDKEAGTPTRVMYNNCIMKLEIMIKEITILKPKLIICLGDPPFWAIQSCFIDSVELIKKEHKVNGFNEWMFKFHSDNESINVIRLFNPGRGHIRVNKIYNNLHIDSYKLPENWRKFVATYTNSGSRLANELTNKFKMKDSADIINPFYDAMIEAMMSEIGLKYYY